MILSIRAIGQLWEECAARFLHTRDIPTIATNIRSPFGEVDLVAIEADVLLFIEVKYRVGSRFGPSFFAVTRRQQKRIMKTASIFLSRNPHYCTWCCRFDIIGFDQRGNDAQLTWLKAAFESTE